MNGMERLKALTMPEWEGPISDAATLNGLPQGSVAIDDVGTMRQLRYGNSYMAGGWTAQGCDPLKSNELLEGGSRPVMVMRPAKSVTP